jgi:hypothetical protein
MYKNTYEYTNIRMDKRENTVEKFVTENQPCTMEQIVLGLHDEISRNPLFEVVAKMFAKGVLVDRKKNRRDHRIFVNKENPLVIVPRQMELFRTSLLDLVKSSPKEIHALYDKPSTYDIFQNSAEAQGFEYAIMAFDPLEILFYTIDMLTLTSTILWPMKMKNRQVIRELYPIIFSNISDMLLELSDILDPQFVFPMGYFEFYYILNIKTHSSAIDSPLLLIRQGLDDYSIINLRDKMELVADALWSLSSDLRQFRYSKTGGEKYHTENDWRDAIIYLPPKSK